MPRQGTQPIAVTPTGRSFHLGLAWLVAGIGRNVIFLLGLLLVLGLLLGLEWSSPYFFTHDDNYHQFLPVILDSLHEVESGHLPAIDPHQAMGMPVFAAGTYSITYPGIYLAYWLGYCLGSSQYFMEVYAIGHILAGYVATYVLLRRLHIAQRVAVCTAMSFVLGAYVLIQGSAWYYTFPTLVFLPLLVGATLSLAEKPTTLRRIGWWGMLCGTYFHAGNAQLWAYTMLFCGLLFLMKVAVSKIWLQKWCALMPAGMLAFVIAAPLLIAQVQLVADIDRNGSSAACMKDCYLNYVLWTRHGYPAYTGSCLFAAGVLSLLVRKWNTWAVLGVVGILSSLGKPGILWLIMADSPVFEKFQHPFKFVLFATFFLLILGAILIDQSRWLRLAVVLNVVLLVAFLASRITGVPAELPYRPLSPSVNQLLGNDRIYSFTSVRHLGEDYPQSMANNFASYYGKNSISSYSDGLTYELSEQIQQRQRITESPLAALQAYGCRWVLVHESFDLVQTDPARHAFVWPEVQRQLPIYEALRSRLVERHRESHMVIYELSDAAPLAFPRGSTDHPLPIEVFGTGMRLQIDTTQPQQSEVIVNFLMRPGYVAHQGEKSLPIQADAWGRIQITLDNHHQDVVITYRPIHW